MRKYLLLLISLILICFNLFCYNQFFDWSKMAGKMHVEFKPYEDSYYLEKGMYILNTVGDRSTIIENYSITSGKMKELMSLPASETTKFNKFKVIIGRNGDYGLERRPLSLDYVFQININNIYNMLYNQSFSNTLFTWANHYGVNYLDTEVYSNSFDRLKTYVSNKYEYLIKFNKNMEYKGDLIEENNGVVIFKYVNKQVERSEKHDIKININGKMKKVKNFLGSRVGNNDNTFIIADYILESLQKQFKKIDFSQIIYELNSLTDKYFLAGYNQADPEYFKNGGKYADNNLAPIKTVRYYYIDFSLLQLAN